VGDHPKSIFDFPIGQGDAQNGNASQNCIASIKLLCKQALTAIFGLKTFAIVNNDV
jgi:hypothetical protein